MAWCGGRGRLARGSDTGTETQRVGKELTTGVWRKGVLNRRAGRVAVDEAYTRKK